MKKRFNQFRIPTAAALVVLFVSIWVSAYLIQQSTNIVGRASGDKTPANVMVSNISDNSFTVTFTTTARANSAISVSSETLEPTTFFDIRNSSSADNSYFSHYINVSNLKPLTMYEFSILSDGQTYLQNGHKYSIKTGPKLIIIPKTTGKVSGKVLLPTGEAAIDTIAITQIQGGQLLSTLTKSNGTFSIPLKFLRSESLNSYYTPTKTTPLSTTFYFQNLTTTVKSTVATAGNLPTTTLSYQYDFSNTQSNVSTASSILKIPQTQVTAGTVSIQVPQASQSFIDSQPQFRGTGIPAKTVNITIQPGQIKATTQVGLNGIWTYRLANPLDPGSYTLQIVTPDNSGTSKSLSQKFSIFGSGSQIAGSGPTVTPTPRQAAVATLTPTPTRKPTTIPTQTPTPTTIALLTPTPVQSGITPTTSLQSPTNTPIPTSIAVATVTPAPTLVAIAPTTPAQTVTNPTAAPTPAATGSLSTIVLGLASFIFIVGGAALLFIL